jgi:hypothetical protein
VSVRPWVQILLLLQKKRGARDVDEDGQMDNLVTQQLPKKEDLWVKKTTHWVNPTYKRSLLTKFHISSHDTSHLDTGIMIPSSTRMLPRWLIRDQPTRHKLYSFSGFSEIPLFTHLTYVSLYSQSHNSAIVNWQKYSSIDHIRWCSQQQIFKSLKHLCDKVHIFRRKQD